MDDNLEQIVLQQTVQVYLKYFSKIFIGVPNFGYLFGNIMKIMRPEVILCIFLVFVLFLYLQVIQLWTADLAGRFSPKLFKKSVKVSSNSNGGFKGPYWQEKRDISSVFAIQGRRPKMEDRFFVDENVNQTGVSLYAIFDGHGGVFAAEYCRSNLILSLYNKLIETMDVVNGKVPAKAATCTDNNNDKKEDNKENIDETNKGQLVQRRKSLKKTLSQEDYDSSTPIDSDLLGHGKLSQQRGPITKETLLNRSNSNRVKKEKEKPKILDAQCYVDKGAVNFGKIITDLVLAADYDLVEKAKKESNVAGTTALIAIIYRNQLIVGNVGDSRGVMCDSKNNAIPLSFDHKPQQTREHKRIKENGGFIEFKGVWRVAGILATSRAMGDYPLKVGDLVIADPDILNFDLQHHKPQFIVLASDGLFDTFTNEEVVNFIRDRLDEPHFGAKSIVVESYMRGSVDNITVLVILLKGNQYKVGSSAA